MKKQTISIKDLSIIENQLLQSKAGVIAFGDEDDEVRQAVVNYVYKDKNIFFAISEREELLEKIQFNSRVCFTVFKTVEPPNAGNKNSHTTFSVSLFGIIKEVDEEKLLNEFVQDYTKKYFKDSSGNQNKSYTEGKVIMIDSEEIQAIEETI